MHCKSKGNKLCIFKYVCFIFRLFRPCSMYCTFLYVLICASFDSFDPIECTILSILYALMFMSFDSFDPIQCTVLYILIYIHVYVFRLFRPYPTYCTVHCIVHYSELLSTLSTPYCK